MEIAEIKQKLTILQVLNHYGLSIIKDHINCPFHNDKTPSMRVYEETNTVYCFSGNCKTHGKSLDVIDFIMHQEGLNKRAAILKAKSLLGVVEPLKVNGAVKSIGLVFTELEKKLVRSNKAKKYLASRGLENLAEVGSNHRSNGSYGYEHLKDCLVFPLKNKKGEVVSLYGRSFEEVRAGKGHYYQVNRKGLYPSYPKDGTQTLILCESVIDAATLNLHGNLDKSTSVLACYGTNGFMSEHKRAIGSLKSLKEVVVFFDGDEAGRLSSSKLGEELKGKYAHLQISIVETQEGEDVNSLWCIYESGDYFRELLGKAKELEGVKELVKVEELSEVTELKEVNDSSPKSPASYECDELKFIIKGSVKYLGDSLKATIQSIAKEGGKSLIQKLDLYDIVSLEKLGKIASRYLGLDLESIVSAWQKLALDLEANQPKGEEIKKVHSISASSKESCINFLKHPNLLERTNAAIGKVGIVGEEQKRLLLFLIASSYSRAYPLQGLIQGSSGSGKTKLLHSIYDLLPKEVKKALTRVSESGFYNYGKYSLRHKCLFIEDLDGLKEDAELALRELQTSQKLISGVSEKSENGKIESVEKVVYGPIASLSCTTRGDYYEDNISRCFVVSVDESGAQTSRIITYQNKLAKGAVNLEEIKKTKAFIANCLRLLKPCEVVNPYADKVVLPEGVHKRRRLHQMYHLLVGQITYFHQYQRKKDSKSRLISESSDMKAAADILLDSIVLKVDELDGSLRQFFEQIKKHFQDKGEDYSFNRFEVMKHLNISKTQLHRYLNSLVELEYIQQYGYANRGYKYKIVHWDDYDLMRTKIKKCLYSQIENL